MIRTYCFYLIILINIFSVHANASRSDWRHEVLPYDLKRPSAVALNIRGNSTIYVCEEKESDSNAPLKGIQVSTKTLDCETWYEEENNTVFVESKPFDLHDKNHYKVILPFGSRTKIFLRAARANVYTENTADIWARIDQGKLTAKNTYGVIGATIGRPGENRTSFEVYNPRNHVSINAPNAGGLIFSQEEPPELLRFELNGKGSAFHWYPPFSIAQNLPETLQLNIWEDQPYRSSSFQNFHLRARGSGTSLTVHSYLKVRRHVPAYHSSKSAKYFKKALKASRKLL